VKKGVNCLHIDQETLTGVENLDQLHAPILCKAFAVNAQDWSVIFCGGSHD